MGRRRNEVNTQRSRSWSLACIVLFSIGLLVACGGRERRAERLYRQALERVERGDTQAAVVLMQELIDDYPDAEIAARVRKEIILYRGLAHAVQSYPVRRARETMIQIARAVESFHKDARRWPASLSELTPAKLGDLPVDPWGHPFEYALAGRGYRLRCLGSDGAAGGEAEAQDILVVDGEFTVAAP